MWMAGRAHHHPLQPPLKCGLLPSISRDGWALLSSGSSGKECSVAPTHLPGSAVYRGGGKTRCWNTEHLMSDQINQRFPHETQALSSASGRQSGGVLLAPLPAVL